MAVSQITAPDLVAAAPPPAALAVFGDRLPLAQRYAELLVGAGVERGLVGPREAGRVWERHLLNCAGLAELLEPTLEPTGVVADIGSGAGLPGLVLAILRDDLQLVLVEPLQRRAAFLTEAVDVLGLANVSVRRARAEDLAGSLEVDAVTARAVAPLDRLGGWALPLLRAGGRLLALKGERAEAELAAARPALRRAGAQDAELVTVGSQEQLTRARVVVVVQGRSGPVRKRARR